MGRIKPARRQHRNPIRGRDIYPNCRGEPGGNWAVVSGERQVSWDRLEGPVAAKRARLPESGMCNRHMPHGFNLCGGYSAFVIWWYGEPWPGAAGSWATDEIRHRPGGNDTA